MTRSIDSNFQRRPGFTLVEILVVIVIIGILAGLALPAVTNVIRTGRETSLKLEVTSIADAAEKYQLEHGDYPPDMSSWTIAQRHFRKAFPRISAIDMSLIYNMCHPGTPVGPSPNPISSNAFDPTAIDRSEALVLFLGGLSSDASSPFTGPGGPFELIAGSTGNPADPSLYQYNISRDNAFLELAPDRLTLVDAQPGVPLRSDDEVAYGGAVDLIPAYQPEGRSAPFLYFDARTYGSVAGVPGAFNGYYHPEFGGVRAYKTNVGVNANPTYGSTPGASLASWQWAGDNSFQIISAGADNIFGTAIWAPLGNPQTPAGSSSASSPLFFIEKTGQAMGMNPSATTFADTLINGIRGFQESGSVSGAEENGHLDNITSFSGSTLENDLESN